MESEEMGVRRLMMLKQSSKAQKPSETESRKPRIKACLEIGMGW